MAAPLTTDDPTTSGPATPVPLTADHSAHGGQPGGSLPRSTHQPPRLRDPGLDHRQDPRDRQPSGAGSVRCLPGAAASDRVNATGPAWRAFRSTCGDHRRRRRPADFLAMSSRGSGTSSPERQKPSWCDTDHHRWQRARAASRAPRSPNQRSPCSSPVPLLISIVTGLGAAQRRERFATLRLIGASPQVVARIAAVETAVPSLIGAVLGVVLAIVLEAGCRADTGQRHQDLRRRSKHRLGGGRRRRRRRGRGLGTRGRASHGPCRHWPPGRDEGCARKNTHHVAVRALAGRSGRHDHSCTFDPGPGGAAAVAGITAPYRRLCVGSRRHRGHRPVAYPAGEPGGAAPGPERGGNHRRQPNPKNPGGDVPLRIGPRDRRVRRIRVRRRIQHRRINRGASRPARPASAHQPSRDRRNRAHPGPGRGGRRPGHGTARNPQRHRRLRPGSPFRTGSRPRSIFAPWTLPASDSKTFQLHRPSPSIRRSSGQRNPLP